jgi:hypothetical protein
MCAEYGTLSTVSGVSEDVLGIAFLLLNSKLQRHSRGDVE